jgi:hypothetical protein
MWLYISRGKDGGHGAGTSDPRRQFEFEFEDLVKVVKVVAAFLREGGRGRVGGV